MRIVLQALAGPAAIGVILGMAILWTRLREPRLDPDRLVPVVDERTRRIADRHVAQLLARGDDLRARNQMTATRMWLRSEVLTGPGRRRVRRARQLEQVELRMHADSP